MLKYKIIWSNQAVSDLDKLKNNISEKMLRQIVEAPKNIIYSSQFQKDA